MLTKKNLVLLSIVSSFSLTSWAGVKVSSLDLNLTGPNGLISVGTEGRSSELPDLKISGKTIEVTLNKADPFQTLNKKSNGASLSASFSGEKALIKATLPYELKADSVNLAWKNNRIEVSFPRLKVSKSNSVSNVSADTTSIASNLNNTNPTTQVTKESLNEAYLSNLMEENKPKEEKTAVVNKDEVSIKQASVASVNNTKTENSSNTFSFAGYAVKFTIFLALVLGLFYGIVQLLKKGVFSRGKLGFLNNAQMIEVLSTSFIAPKKSLMVIRVHKQIFLVANSEAGITLLSEMKDTSGLIKEGEKQITGTNFDENITTAEFNNSDNFRIKENILESSPLPPETRIEKLVAAKDDIVKFSDELKKKAKKLRPIENRAN